MPSPEQFRRPGSSQSDGDESGLPLSLTTAETRFGTAHRDGKNRTDRKKPFCILFVRGQIVGFGKAAVLVVPKNIKKEARYRQQSEQFTHQ
jgi:hypothetical protein